MRASATTWESEVSKAELSAILDALQTSDLKGKHLEIGTAAGGTLKAMMSAYSSDHRPQFVVVDPFTYYPRQQEIVEQNLRSAGLDPTTVDFRVGKSWTHLGKALKNGERFSFIFIDGDHRTLAAIQDLMWTRLLDVGGLVCLHDYRPKFRGVIWATERFLRRQTNYTRIAAVDSLVILRKERASTRPEVDWSDVGLGAILQSWHRLQWSLDKSRRQTN